jgi:hypothetical protein
VNSIIRSWLITLATQKQEEKSDENLPIINKTRGVSHFDLAIYIEKYLKAKEELSKLNNFTMQKYNLQKVF